MRVRGGEEGKNWGIQTLIDGGGQPASFRVKDKGKEILKVTVGVTSVEARARGA